MMRRFAFLLAGLMAAGLLTTSAVAGDVQLNISSVFNYDAVGTKGEIDYCNTQTTPLLPVAQHHRLDHILGDHQIVAAGAYVNQASTIGAGRFGLPDTGLADIFEIGKGVTNPYGPLTWTAGIDPVPTKTPNCLYLDAGPTGFTTRFKEIVVVEQAKYSEINFLFTGYRYGLSEATARTYSAKIEVKYSEDLDYATPALWSNSTLVPSNTILAGGSFTSGGIGNKGYFSYGTDDAPWGLAYTCTSYLAGGGVDTPIPNRYSYVREDATGGRYLWKFATPLALIPSKTLEKIKITLVAGGVNRNNKLWLFAATAKEAGGAGGDPSAATSTVETIPAFIPNDNTTASTIKITLKDVDSNRIPGKAADITITAADTTVGSITEVDAVNQPGVYTAPVTSGVAGDKTINVSVATSGSPVDLTPATLNVYDPAVPYGLNCTVTANPNLIPDDGAYGSTITIRLKDRGNNPISGAAADLKIGEGGVDSGATVTESAVLGTYTGTFISTAAGLHTIQGIFRLGQADEVIIPSTVGVTVFTPGAGIYPKADAGPDMFFYDTAGTSRVTVTLDASASYDDVGIYQYTWTKGTTVIYQGPDAVHEIVAQLGVHDLALTVLDAATGGRTHRDTMTLTIAVPEGDVSTQLDLSGAFNYDGLISTAEVAHSNLYLPVEQWPAINARVYVNRVFGQHGMAAYNVNCPVVEGQTGFAIGIPASGQLHTMFGTFQLSTLLDNGPFPATPIKTVGGLPSETPPYDSPVGQLLTRSNMIYCRAAQVVEVPVTLAQQANYGRINFIMAGSDPPDGTGTNPLAGSLVRFYANYEGEGTGAAGTLLWESPIVESRQSGVPSLRAVASSNPEIAEAFFMDSVWGIAAINSSIRTDDARFWTFASYLRLESSKKLVGFTIETTGTEQRVFVLAASTLPPMPQFNLIVNGGSGSGPQDAGSVVAISAITPEGKMFSSWTGPVADPNAANTTVTMTGDIEVTANFVDLMYTLSVVGGTGSGTFAPGSVIPIEATVPAGQAFVNWTGDVATVANANAAATTITMNGNYTVTANLGNVWTLTVIGGTGSGTFAEGSLVPIVATIPPGGTFLGWGGDTTNLGSLTEASTTVLMYGDYTVTANFEGGVTVTASGTLSRNWVYQNTTSTTGNRHLVYLSVTASGGTAYSVAVTKDPTSVGDVAIESTADPLVWIIRGSARQAGGTINTGLVKLNITVTDTPSSTVGTAQVEMTCRPLGDIDAVGGVNGQDKLQMNKRLNGLVPDGPEYDLDGLGGSNGQDKLIINKILNGILIP